MATSKQHKQQLLNTLMHKLNLGGAFNNWFYNKEKMNENTVLTLKEFITLNQKLFFEHESFVCWRPDTPHYLRPLAPLRKEHASFKKLREFLIEQGFTHKDWVVLLPHVQNQGPDFSKLPKNTLRQVRIHHLLRLKTTGHGFKWIQHATEKRREKSTELTVSIQDVLNIPKERMQGWYVARSALKCIKRKLKALGFKKNDGYIMRMDLSVKTKEDYCKDALKLGFNKNEAEIAIDVAIAAGWIKA